MPFTEGLKLKVRRRAHFACCLCHDFGVEIHHIIPQEDGGPDDEDNAAPLCPSCHEKFGANPTKRKVIREMRDFWYEICETRFPADYGVLREIKDAVSGTAKSEELAAATEAIITAIKNHGPLAHGFSIELGTAPPEDWERAIRSLRLEDVIAKLITRETPRQASYFDLLFYDKLWPEEDGYAEVRSEFLALFGKFVAEGICKEILDEMGLKDEDGVTAPEIVAILEQIAIKAALLVHMHSGDIEAALRDDGEILFRLSNSEKSI